MKIQVLFLALMCGVCSTMAANSNQAEEASFLTGRHTKSVPEGLVLTKGEKIRIEFRVEKAIFGFGFNHPVDKIERIDK